MPLSGKSPLVRFFLVLLLIFFLARFGPEERALGSNVRIVYLHGAWVLTAEAAFAAAALTGLLALAGYFLPSLRRMQPSLHRWSAALGRTGIVFWLTYLPLSLWAMQTNWNGLFLSEPRFRLALTFAVTGVLLQIGLGLVSLPPLASAGNVLFFLVLRFAFSRAQNVMHPPPSPIFRSGLWHIIAFFVALNLLTGLAGWFLCLWWKEGMEI